MKRIHVFFLIALCAAIAILLSFATELSTYDTIASAQEKKGAYVHIIAKIDRSFPLDYDPVHRPNQFTFYASDTTGMTMKVIYHNAKPVDIEKSTQIVLKGQMQQDYFSCDEILLKCPSKYKDEREGLDQTFSES